MSHLNLPIVAFLTNFCPIEIDLSMFDRKLQLFQKSIKLTIFRILMNLCPLKM